MKLKSLIFFTLIVLVTGSAFAQKPEPPKPAVKPIEAPTPAPVKLPTASEVIANYVKAVGGREANEKIKTRIMTGAIELSPAGIKGTVEIYSAAPDKSYQLANLIGIGIMTEGYDGKVAWSVNPMQGNRVKSGQEALQAKIASNFYRDINIEKLYSKIEVRGVEKVGDKDAYVLVATPEGIPPDTYYFDKVSGLLLRTDSTAVAPEGSSPFKSFYEDYRDVDGIKVPFKLRTVLPQYEVIVTFTEVKNNVPIDDAKFAKPL